MTQTYTVKLHGKRAMAQLADNLKGWWSSQPGAVIQMRDATTEDLDGVFLRDDMPKDPALYLRELHGPWVLIRSATASIRSNGEPSL